MAEVDITIDGNLPNAASASVNDRLLIVQSGELRDITVGNFLPQPSYSQAVLGADFSITGASGQFQDTGLSLSLPAAGSYLILGDVRYRLLMASGTFASINVKLYNSTLGADVTNSLRRCIYTSVLNQFQSTIPMTLFLTTTGAQTIKLYAARSYDGTITSSDIASGSTTGLTTLAYLKIG